MFMTTMKPLYSKVYDFETRDKGPDNQYVIMTSPRSGSTSLSLMLWRTGCMGAPLEYLNLDRLKGITGPRKNRAFSAYWSKIKSTRTSANGVFGLKVFANFAYAIQQAKPMLFSELFRHSKLIRLTRSDQVAQAVSLARALQTKRWYSPDAESGLPSYDFEQIAEALHRIKTYEIWWDALLESLGRSVLHLTYEQISARPEQAVDQVAHCLGISLAASCPLELPTLNTQRDELSQHWCDRFRREAEGRALP